MAAVAMSPVGEDAGDFHAKEMKPRGLRFCGEISSALAVSLGAKMHSRMKLSITTALRAAASRTDAGVAMRLLAQLFEHTPDTAFFINDAQGRYIAVNQSLLERHGLRSRAQMLGRRPCDVCPGDCGRIPAQQDAVVLRTGRPIIERLELQWYSPHIPGWHLTTKLPMRDTSGAVCGIIGISKDVRSPVAPQEIPAGVEAALARFAPS